MTRLHTKIEEPTHSLDPADWWMYCDLLQDRGAPRKEWSRANRVANSLSKSKDLVLIFHCPAGSLDGHWLRVGSTWFIPVEGTYVSYVTDFRWWRPHWVKRGFALYPSVDSSSRYRKITSMIRYAGGTPYLHEYSDFENVNKKFGDRVVKKFFETHARRRLPNEWA